MVYAREAIAAMTVQVFAPHLLVVDHAPAGLFREMARAIAWLRAALPTTKLVLLMRDITFGLEQTRTIWQNEGAYPLFDEVYDRILVYGSQEVFDPIAAYGLSETAAAKTRYCGYLEPPPATRTPAEVRRDLGFGERPFVAVSVGGGYDGGPLLRAFLSGFAEYAPPELAAYVVAGPLLPAAERDAVAALAADLDRVRLVDFDPDYLAVAAAADAIVSMGGYNSMTEAAFLGKRAIVLPRTPGPEEQIIRARRFEALGLVSVVAPEELGPERLWSAIRAELAAPATPAVRLPFAGTATIVAELAAALDAATAPSTER